MGFQVLHVHHLYTGLFRVTKQNEWLWSAWYR